MSLRICTYNIHKGFSQFNRRMMIHELRDRLRQLDTDIVFLQEVQGLHLGHARRHADWPSEPQHQFLARDIWPSAAYGGNAIYDHGHHGNAILSRYPIISSHNQDVSDHRFERRGLLHCEIQVDENRPPVHAVCVHLGLFAGSRRRQMDALARRMTELAPADAPMIVAGDFNDWRNHAPRDLLSKLDLREVFSPEGRPPRSYPSAFPMFRLDRIYVRGLEVEQSAVHCGPPWSRISDHAALTADFRLPE